MKSIQLCFWHFRFLLEFSCQKRKGRLTSFLNAFNHGRKDVVVESCKMKLFEWFSNTVKSVFSLLNCHLFFEAVYLILYSVMLGPLALFIVTMKMMRSLPGPARSVMVVDVGDASLKIQWIVWMMHATNEFCRGLRHRTNWLCASTQLLMIADAYEISFPKSFERIFQRRSTSPQLQHNHQLAVSVIIFIIFQCKTDTCLSLTGCWKIIVTIDNLLLFIFSNYRSKFRRFFWKLSVWKSWKMSHLQHCERSELRIFLKETNLT